MSKMNHFKDKYVTFSQFHILKIGSGIGKTMRIRSLLIRQNDTDPTGFGLAGFPCTVQYVP